MSAARTTPPRPLAGAQTRHPAGSLAVPARSADSARSARREAVSGRRAATVPDESRGARENREQWGYTPLRRTNGAAGGSRVERAAAARLAALASGDRAALVRAQLETFRTSFLERDQLGTFCTEPAALDLDAAGNVLAEQLADDPRAHYFRREVARHLAPYWERRARALVSCGEAGARCDCGDCGARHVLPYRCGARSCPTCAKVASAVAVEKTCRRAELAAAEWNVGGTWDGPGDARPKAWRMLTLTTVAPGTDAERYAPDVLRAYVKATRAGWGDFWRSVAWGRRVHDVSASGRPTKRARRDTMFAMGLEVAPGGMVHIHAAIYGEYIESAEIAAAWRRACPYGGFVKLRLMRDRATGAAVQPHANGDAFREALREVLKYVTKGDKEPGIRAERAAAVEWSLRNIRRVETGGVLRKVNVTAADVATNEKECEHCGAAGSWRWRGMRAAPYVRRNGGFGLAHIVDDDDAEQLRADARVVHMQHQQHARELAAVEARERRPGGRFYGGDAPPWYDDPADDYETIDDTARVRSLGKVARTSRATKPPPRR